MGFTEKQAEKLVKIAEGKIKSKGKSVEVASLNPFKWLGIEGKDKAENKGKDIYEVKKGDTLSKIAKANGMSLEELLELNPQLKQNPDLIHPGDEIKLKAEERSVLERGKEIIGNLAEKVGSGIKKLIGRIFHKDIDYNKLNAYEVVIEVSNEVGIEPAILAATWEIEAMGLRFTEENGEQIINDGGRAIGPMQLWPSTRRGFAGEGEDPDNNPIDNIKAGARFLKHLYNKYYERFKDLDTMKWIYGAYNLGEPRFDRFWKKYGTNLKRYDFNGSWDKMNKWEEKHYNKYKKIFK